MQINNSDVRCELLDVGYCRTPVIVVDNLLRDPGLLVDFCSANYNFSRVDNYYPGVRMLAPKMYLHEVYSYLSVLFANVFGWEKESLSGGRAFYSLVVTPPDQLKPQQCLPHVDSFGDRDFACVHYLCDEKKGGTSIYRHKKTGIERITEDNVDYYNQAVNEEGALIQLEGSYMNGSNAYFEQIACVEAVFNRMVIYPANVLHSGNISKDFTFDSNPSRGRLTINSFLYSKRPS